MRLPSLNWKRGSFRLYVASSALWIAWGVVFTTFDCDCHPFSTTRWWERIWSFVSAWLVVSIIGVVVFLVGIWVIKGFEKTKSARNWPEGSDE